MPIDVVPLTKADIPAAIDIIQCAFADDPYFKWVFDPAKFNKQRNRDSLAARCLWGIENALFYVAKETVATSTSNNDNDNDNDTTPSPSQSPSSAPSDHAYASPADDKTSQILGISCWLPPSPPSASQTWSSWLTDHALLLRQTLNNIRYLGRGGLRAGRYFVWKARQAEAQARLWDDPRGYYFCNMVAVSPEAQGRGVGKRLFEVVTNRADQEGLRCYLESSKMVPNVEVYGRLGFGLCMEMECKEGDGDEDEGCMLYCMMREPKAKN